ncbi:winged helix DNA-binding domain-containing protein [Bacteroides sp.]
MSQIAQLRLQTQQLVNPQFSNPKELVSWMGAIQAQDATMAKWAVGIRLDKANLNAIDAALEKGEILRMHVMRPMWHYVTAEDARWMIRLSAERIKAANASYAKSIGRDISENLFLKCCKQIERILEGNRHLTKQEIEEELQREGLIVNEHDITRFLLFAETEGIVCSGADKGNKQTYALLEERIAPAKELHRDEALAQLALRYFKSHSPASLNDFVWWSGLTMGDARKAISFIESELLTECIASQDYFIHESCQPPAKSTSSLHFLPPFDEYLISYKDRSAVLASEHQHKAFNNWGTFYPVIAHKGKIVGNWKKAIKKKELTLETSFFEPATSVAPKLMEQAKKKYKAFLLAGF